MIVRGRLQLLIALVLSAMAGTPHVLAADSWTEDQGQPGTEADALALGLDVAEQLGPPPSPPRTGAVLQEATRKLAQRLRCTVCQGLSIEASPSETARNMKRQVRAMLAAGYEPEQIEDYFSAAYGDFVRMAPRRQGFTLLVWLLPVAALILGAVLGLRAVLRRSAKNSAPQSGTDSDESPEQAGIDPELEPYLARIRAEVEGERA